MGESLAQNRIGIICDISGIGVPEEVLNNGFTKTPILIQFSDHFCSGQSYLIKMLYGQSPPEL